MKRLRAIAFITCCFWTTFYYAQPQKKTSTDPDEAKEHFSHHNYLMAMPIYKALLQQDTKNTDYNYRLGVCYMRTHLNKAEAVKYFEVVTQASKYPNDAWFFLGKSYHIAGKYDEAIESFTKYKTLVPKDKKEIDKTDRQIEMCSNAKELVKFPVNITFTNLGPDVNTEYPDYFPFITADEQTLFYTSRRKGGHASAVESDGYFSSDIFFSTVLDGKWEKSKNLSAAVNTKLDEELVGLKPDGSELIIYIDHIDNDKIENLYSTHKRNNAYVKIEKLSESVTNAKEYAGTIADTDNGPVLFFARQDNTCIGETDIFMAKQLPNGQWALPQNLGSNINTPYKEDFPFLSADCKTLYFSSEGHSSMGGYDLFKSSWDEETQSWSKPQNLGYPINTADDEQQICMLSDNRAGYYSAYRPGGLGDLDIYRIKFEDEEQKFSIIRGMVGESDTLKKVCVNVTINVTNKKTNEEITFKPNPSTGQYVMALLPGKYAINVVCEGYKEIKEDLTIFDFGTNKPETIKDYRLSK